MKETILKKIGVVGIASALLVMCGVSSPAEATPDTGSADYNSGAVVSWTPPDPNSLYEVHVTAYGGRGGNGAPDGPGSFGHAGKIGFITLSFSADSAFTIYPGGNGGDGFKSGSELGLSTGGGNAGISSFNSRFNGGAGGHAGLTGWSGGGGGGGAATVIGYGGDFAVAAGGAGGGGGANCPSSGGDGASTFLAIGNGLAAGADGKRPTRDGGGSGGGGGGYVGGQSGDFSYCGVGTSGEPWGLGGYPGSNDSDFGEIVDSGYSSELSRAGNVHVEWSLISGPGIRAPRSLAVVSRDYTAIDVSWSAPASTDPALIDGYVVEWSNDEGKTWSESATLITGLSYRISGLSSGSAYLIRVAAKNETDQGPYSGSIFATTKGLKSSTLTVTDAAGEPVTGGAVTWALDDGTAWSSKTYGLTATGQIVFPATAAGRATLTLVDGITADGARVSGSWNIILGYNGLTAALPSAPAPTRTVIVSMPNGQPIGGVDVAWDSSPTDEVEVDGFVFSAPAVRVDTVTDSFGVAVAHGYFDSDPEVTLTYVDSIVSQRQWVTLAHAVTSVELEYSPWVEATDTSVTTSATSSTEVAVEVTLPDGFGAPLPSSITRTISGLAGITVNLTGGGSAPKKCSDGTRPKLNAVTDSSGVATFRICPKSSTTYRLSSADVVASGAVEVLVTRSAPNPVKNLVTRSTGPGVLDVSWDAPDFTGGSAIKSYVVTVQKVGSRAKIVREVKSASANFEALDNASDYSVAVVAKTKYGTSPLRTALVGVV